MRCLATWGLLAVLASLPACGGDDADGSGAGGSAGSGAASSGGTGAGGSAGSASGGSAGALPADAKPPYAPDFALNLKIPAAIASDPNSDAVVARLKTNTSTHKVTLSARLDVPTVYQLSASDPEYTVNVSYLPQMKFRVRAGAVPGGGSDLPLLLLDPDQPEHGPFTELRVWQANIDHAQKTLTGNGGGLFHYNNDGALLNPDKSPSHSIPFAGAGTGSGLSYLAGLIRPAEVAAGTIPHAIRFAYSNCDSSDQFRAPAVKTDQPKNCNATQPPANERMDMGMRLQLDPGVDCSARTVPDKADSSSETRFLRMFCVALQDYGMVMLDGTGPGGVFFYIEHEDTGSWGSVIGAELYESFSYLIRDQDTPSDGLTRGPSDGIPWQQLRVLEKSAW